MSTTYACLTQWRHDTILAAGGSKVVMVPSFPYKISVLAAPATGGTGKVEYTLSGPEAIDAGTAKWTAWTPGDAVAPAYKEGWIESPITAVRLSTTGGACSFSVLG